MKEIILNDRRTGETSKFYIDVKISVKAGMEIKSNDYKLKTIAIDIFRLYYDSQLKDRQIGSVRLKRKYLS